MLLTLLIKARIQIAAGSALVVLFVMLQALIFLTISSDIVLAAGGAAVYAMQQRRTAWTPAHASSDHLLATSSPLIWVSDQRRQGNRSSGDGHIRSDWKSNNARNCEASTARRYRCR